MNRSFEFRLTIILPTQPFYLADVPSEEDLRFLRVRGIRPFFGQTMRLDSCELLRNDNLYLKSLLVT
jgi:hypothetical protein